MNVIYSVSTFKFQISIFKVFIVIFCFKYIFKSVLGVLAVCTFIFLLSFLGLYDTVTLDPTWRYSCDDVSNKHLRIVNA